MNISARVHKNQNARLADFEYGWTRHPDHNGIVLIEHDYPQIFLIAADDASCQAAILTVTEEQK